MWKIKHLLYLHAKVVHYIYIAAGGCDNKIGIDIDSIEWWEKIFGKRHINGDAGGLRESMNDWGWKCGILKYSFWSAKQDVEMSNK